MTATSKTYRVVKGQAWSRAVFMESRTDAVTPVVTPMPLVVPAMMDVRTGAARTSTLIYRFDSDPVAGEGLIESDGLARGGLILTAPAEHLEALALSPSGGWHFDIWARLATAPDDPILVMHGRFILVGRTTDEIITDD